MISPDLGEYGFIPLELEKPRDHCAVVGSISFSGRDVSNDVVLGLGSLQHRGQDGSGIAAYRAYQRRFATHKDIGLVGKVFPDTSTLERYDLQSGLAIGHNRYATSGAKDDRRALQPFLIERDRRSLTIAHNGNIPDRELWRLRAELPRDVPLQANTDTEILGWRIMLAEGETWEAKVKAGLLGVKGSFALVMATDEGQLIGVRDPWANRPLMLGHTADGAMLASETHGFERVAVRSFEEVGPGEMVVAYGGQVDILPTLPPAAKRARCIVEPIYFAHTNSHEGNLENRIIRRRMGEELAREFPMGDIDIICGVPDGGTHIAQGYAHELGRHTDDVITKDRYGAGIRTFIQSSDVARKTAVDGKFSVSDAVEGKTVVFIDDSIVRGNTTKRLIARTRAKGAREVHALSSSPPFIEGCDLGVDIASQRELLGLQYQGGTYRRRSAEEIAGIIGADSVGYLSLEGLVRATGRCQDEFCTHCLTGKHPIFDGQNHRS